MYNDGLAELVKNFVGKGFSLAAVDPLKHVQSTHFDKRSGVMGTSQKGTVMGSFITTIPESFLPDVEIKKEMIVLKVDIPVSSHGVFIPAQPVEEFPDIEPYLAEMGRGTGIDLMAIVNAVRGMHVQMNS